MNPISLLFKKLHPDAKIPTVGTKYSAGYDLYALEGGECPARGRCLVRTGIAVRLPPSDGVLQVYGSIRSRSSLSYKHGIEVGAGVIDYDYTGDVGVILFNHSDVPFQFDAHDKIAQLVVEVHMIPQIQVVEEFPPLVTDRTGGFGSTGKN